MSPYFRSVFAAVCLITILAGCEMGSLFSGSGDGKKTKTLSAEPEAVSPYADLLKNRPQPDLETLAARSIPNIVNPDTDAFLDLLVLRDHPDEKAVPALTAILENHQESTQIHRFAAAQALYAVGNKKAEAALKQYLLTPQFPARNGIDFARAWAMPAKQRIPFLKTYHLVNLNDDLKVELAVNEKEKGRVFDVTLTLTNTGEATAKFFFPEQYIAELLYVRSANGFLRRMTRLRKHDKIVSDYKELAPGKSHAVTIRLTVRSLTEVTLDDPAPGTRFLLCSDDLVFALHEPGKCEILALFEAQPMSDKEKKMSGITDAWAGRIVSDAVKIKIKEPKEKPAEKTDETKAGK